jgi:hypothetical protein
MKTLDDAWRWYHATRDNLDRMHRLARRYWQALPWEGSLGRDDDFRTLEDEEVLKETKYSLDFLDDLTVVVLFSVFEQTIRDQVRDEVQAESAGLIHPVLRKAAEDVTQAIEVGSFARVLEPYKVEGHADLIEEVNQVRRYRNWVAHGRRGEQPPSVAPRMAYERLTRFLVVVIPSESGPESPT